MRRVLLSMFVAVLIASLLTGCALFGGSGVEEIPVDETPAGETPVEEGGAIQPAAEGQVQPVPEQPDVPETGGEEVGGGDIPIETAQPGEVIFIREGQLMVIGADGTNERQLTFAVSGSVAPNLALSPDGHFLAFTVDRQAITVIDLELGGTTVIDQAENAQIDSLVWSQDSLTLYYHKLTFDPETSIPSESQLWMAPMPPGLPPTLVTSAPLSTRVTVVPRFGLTGSQLIIQQVPFGGGGDLGAFFLYDTASDSLTPLAEGYGVWDAYVAPDKAKLILFSETPGDDGLYVADLDAATGTVSNISDILNGDFIGGRFDPNGESVLAFVALDNGDRGAVILQPYSDSERSGYKLTPLPTEPGAKDVDFSWNIGPGVIVQRVLPGSQSEILLLPLDGSAGTIITTGESPRVVTGR